MPFAYRKSMPLFRRSKRNQAVAEVAEPVAEAPDGPVVPRSVTEQAKLVLASVRPLRPFGMHLMDTYGLTLCEDIVADLALPSFTQAAVAGWGIRATDVRRATEGRAVRLPVIDEIEAGGFPGPPVTMAACVKVEEGSPLPEGVNAVVAAGSVTELDGEVLFDSIVVPGTNVLREGSEVAEGEVLLRSGTRVDARAIAVLAESGHDKILVRPRPRVVVMTVGPNLVAPGLALGSRADRYDATTAMIAAAARADGAQCYAVGAVGSDPDHIRQVISDQLIRADLVITVGGLGGDDPLMTQVLTGLGKADFTPVDMAPAPQQGFATVGDDRTPLLMLPGRPIAAFITYQNLVRPVVKSLSGFKVYAPKAEKRPTLRPISNDSGSTLYVPAQLTPDGVIPLSGASLAARLASVDVLIVLPPEVTEVEVGEDVDCQPLEG